MATLLLLSCVSESINNLIILFQQVYNTGAMKRVLLQRRQYMMFASTFTHCVRKMLAHFAPSSAQT